MPKKKEPPPITRIFSGQCQKRDGCVRVAGHRGACKLGVMEEEEYEVESIIAERRIAGGKAREARRDNSIPHQVEGLAGGGLHVEFEDTLDGCPNVLKAWRKKQEAAATSTEGAASSSSGGEGGGRLRLASHRLPSPEVLAAAQACGSSSKSTDIGGGGSSSSGGRAAPRKRVHEDSPAPPSDTIPSAARPQAEARGRLKAVVAGSSLSSVATNAAADDELMITEPPADDPLAGASAAQSLKAAVEPTPQERRSRAQSVDRLQLISVDKDALVSAMVEPTAEDAVQRYGVQASTPSSSVLPAEAAEGPLLARAMSSRVSPSPRTVVNPPMPKQSRFVQNHVGSAPTAHAKTVARARAASTSPSLAGRGCVSSLAISKRAKTAGALRRWRWRSAEAPKRREAASAASSRICHYRYGLDRGTRGIHRSGGPWDCCLCRDCTRGRCW